MKWNNLLARVYVLTLNFKSREKLMLRNKIIKK